MISQWKSEFIKNASDVFEKTKDDAGKLQKELDEKEARYQQIIGQMSCEIDWLKNNLASSSTAQARKMMAEPGNERISSARQAWLLTVNRTSLYRRPAASAWAEIDLLDMNLIDKIYTGKPFYGYRQITEEMNACSFISFIKNCFLFIRYF
jgi:putative transposase